MRTTKDFLQQECLNLSAVLEETLRFKFGLDGSQRFFDECSTRLTFINNSLCSLKPTDSNELQNVAIDLAQLSALISRIERSSLGEYSWPFVDELKRIAVAICTEETVTDSNREPLVHVLSDGGLDKYRIFTEANRPSSAGKRILTIVFPRSLKHFVLLHSILGHEIGHAMWQCSKHQNALKAILQTHLFSSGTFATEKDTATWLYSEIAPDATKLRLASLEKTLGVRRNNFFRWASWSAWKEEILCDFIGLLTFGPSFVAAECNLLYSFDSDGAAVGQQHPPVGCRANYLLTGASIRGYDKATFADASLANAVRNYWINLKARKQSNPWFDVFSDTQIRDTADAIAALLQPLFPACYTSPSESDLKHLVSQLNRTVPPVGFTITDDRTSRCWKIDFRHILYSGWLKSIDAMEITFEQLNRLCEHAIMQQRAIDTDLNLV